MRDRGGTFAPISPPEAGYPYPSVKHGPSWTKVRLSNPWLEPHHYTAAIDWMLEVVDGIEEGAFACRERVVGFSANYLLRCDPALTKIARRGRCNWCLGKLGSREPDSPHKGGRRSVLVK